MAREEPRRQVEDIARKAVPKGIYHGRLAEEYDGISQYVLVSLSTSSVSVAAKARVAAGDFGTGQRFPVGTPVSLSVYRGKVEVLSLGTKAKESTATIPEFCGSDTAGVAASYGSAYIGASDVALTISVLVPSADSALAVFVELPAGGSVTSVTWRPTAGSAVGEEALTTRATALLDPGAGNLRSYSIDNPTPGTGAGGAGEIRVVHAGPDATAGVIRIDGTTGYLSSASNTSSSSGPSTVNPTTTPNGYIATGISSENAANTSLTTGTDRAHLSTGVTDPQGLEIGSQPVGAGATTPVTWSHTAGSRGMIALSFAGSAAALSGGSADLIGSSNEIARCDHAHHVWRTTAPTTADNRDAGYLAGTVWIQVNNLTTPTSIIGRWRLINQTAGTWISERGGAERKTLMVVLGSGTAVIPVGTKGYVPVTLTGTIVEWRALADVSGSIQVDVWRDTQANHPATVADSITGTNEIVLTTADEATDTVLTSWTRSITNGDTLAFNVDSVTTIKQLTIALVVELT